MRILFTTATRIGDAVLSTGLLAGLIARHPGARVTVACGPLPAPLFRAVPGLDQVIPMPKRRHGGHWLALWRQVAPTRWDLVVDLRNSALSYVLLTRRRLVARPSKVPEHRVVHLGRLLGAEATPAPRLWLDDAAIAAATALIPEGPPVLGVGPTANWIGKSWPAERYAEAVTRLTAADGPLAGARVAVFAAPSERAAAEPVLTAVPEDRRIDLTGGVDLLAAAACLGRCSLYLGNDSGLMHMAAAAGTPTLGLFGPSPDTLYAPWGSRAAVVRTPESLAELTALPGFTFHAPRSYMTGLTVDAVIAAATALWRRCNEGG